LIGVVKIVPISFAKDIARKFRSSDIGCMAPKGVLLGNAQWMCDAAAGHGFDDHANARRVYAALEDGVMPPDHEWPEEWLDTYRRWMEDGFNP
jgi:hypothetical protein